MNLRLGVVMKKNKYKIIEPFLNKEKKLKDLSSEHDIPYSTLKRWIKLYKEFGIKGLSKKIRSDKDSFRKADDETIKFVLKEHKKNPNINITTLYNNYLTFFKNKNINKLSYNTIYRIAINLDPFSQKIINENLNNIKKSNNIYRISTEKLYIKNLDVNDGVATIIIIYDVYDNSIINYKLFIGEAGEDHYLVFIRETIIKNKLKNYLVKPKYIFIDDFKMKNKERFFKILKELNININGNLDKNKEMTKFVRFLEKDITNIFKERPLSLNYLNHNLEKYICNSYLKEISEENKLFDYNKLDFLFKSVDRKVQNYGIRFKNNLYTNELLKEDMGKIVTLRYNPFDLNVLKVYQDNKYSYSIYLLMFRGRFFSKKEIYS